MEERTQKRRLDLSDSAKRRGVSEEDLIITYRRMQILKSRTRVLGDLTRLGVKVGRATIRNYYQAGLCPTPVVIGRGRGRETVFWDVTPEEIYASKSLLDQGLPSHTVALARGLGSHFFCHDVLTGESSVEEKWTDLKKQGIEPSLFQFLISIDWAIKMHEATRNVTSGGTVSMVDGVLVDLTKRSVFEERIQTVASELSEIAVRETLPIKFPGKKALSREQMDAWNREYKMLKQKYDELEQKYDESMRLQGEDGENSQEGEDEQENLEREVDV